MRNTNAGFILGIGLLLCALLFIVRLVAMKLHHDPIANKYKPGTPEYVAYMRFIGNQSFTIALGSAILMTILTTVYVISVANKLIKIGTPSSHYMLIFGPLSAVAVVVAGCIFAAGLVGVVGAVASVFSFGAAAGPSIPAADAACYGGARAGAIIYALTGGSNQEDTSGTDDLREYFNEVL